MARNSEVVSLGNGLRGEKLPPLFFDRLTQKDLEVIKKQVKNRKFDASLVLGVAKRCAWGMPAVIVCGPMKALKPFPTSFWLTCPYMVKACDKLESVGGVRQLEEYLKGNSQKWKAFIVAHALVRMALLDESQKNFLIFRKRRMWDLMRKGGPGGIMPKDKVTVKCLHLQVASWAALGWHPGELWLKTSLPAFKCPVYKEMPCFY